MLHWADRRAWRQARTLPEIGYLAADWLEGSRRWSPSYGSRPDPETAELMPLLADLNRAGYVTGNSQPGHIGRGYDGAHWEQRAGVDGFCSEELAEAIQDSALDNDMHVTVYDPAGKPWDKDMDGYVVTTRNGQPFTTFGHWLGASHMDLNYGQLHPRAIGALRRAHQVTVVDTQWGRTEQLWRALEPLTNFTEES